MRPARPRSLFEEAFHNSPALAAIVRIPDNVIVEVNEAFARTLGFRREEALGKTPFELQFWLNPEKLPAFRAQLEADGFVRNYEAQVRTKSGDVRTVLLSSQVVQIDGVPHSMSAGVDITEQKRVEAELQKALVDARELTQLKSDFVSLVSHEFRTPLEVIMSSTDNLERYHDRLTPEKRQQLLRTINKSVSRMSYMMEDVLLMGRIESGRVDFKPVVFDLDSFCHRLCDEIVLRHILTNLLSNAMKFSPAGEAVELTVSRERLSAVFSVADRGCGIPAADQARLFQAFHRGSNVRQLPGTGLGLVIVQRSVSLHGGEIQFTSVEGKGTTFTVRLPLFAKIT